MSPVRNDATCYLAKCATNFADAKASGVVALAPGDHAFKSGAGDLDLYNGAGAVLAVSSRPGQGVVLGAPQPLNVQLSNMQAPAQETWDQWGARIALNNAAKLKVHALRLGGQGEDRPLLTATAHPTVQDWRVWRDMQKVLLTANSQVQDGWDGLRHTVTQALCTGLQTILRRDMIASAGLVDLANSDLRLSWQGGQAANYARTIVEPGLTTLRLGAKVRQGAQPAEDTREVGARLTHDLTLVDRESNARTPLRLKAKCLLDAEGPALTGNTHYPEVSGPWKRDADMPRYITPAIKGLFTTATATGSLKLGTARVACADLIGVYDDPTRSASSATALARNFALDLRGQRVSVASASPERGLTLRADKPIRIVAPRITGLLPSQLHWLDRLLAKVVSFSLRQARILPGGRQIEVKGTLRVFGLPWPVTTRVPMPDLDDLAPLDEAERTLVDVERLMADPKAHVKPITQLIDMKRTQVVAEIARDGQLAFGDKATPQVLQARDSRIVAKASKKEPQRFKVGYAHRTGIVMGEGKAATTRKVRVGVSASVPVSERTSS